jgi:hypothetical protein
MSFLAINSFKSSALKLEGNPFYYVLRAVGDGNLEIGVPPGLLKIHVTY